MKFVATITSMASVAFCIGAAAMPARMASSAQPATAPACDTPVHHQFDFWIGDWDAFDSDNPNKVVARTQVTRILGGCVLLEDYQGADGHFGQSFTIYDSSRQRWHQTWVTNLGTLLMIEGSFADGKMVLQGADRMKGNIRQVRGTWTAVPEGVREHAVISIDGGKSWTQWFDLIFRPHKS